MLTINNVTYGYNKYHNVFKNFTLEFNEGGIYGLLGKNGTGKSTLLYLIMGLLRPQVGSVTFNGIDTRLRRPETLGDMFIVPEEYNLPSVSLKKYISSIRPFYPNFSEELLKECLEGFNMTNDVNLGALSMGQKKKVYMFVVTAVDVLVSLCLCNPLYLRRLPDLSFSTSLSVLALYFLYSAAALSTACLWLTLPFPCNSCSPLIVRIRSRCSAQSFMVITCSRSAWRSAKSRSPETS